MHDRVNGVIGALMPMQVYITLAKYLKIYYPMKFLRTHSGSARSTGSFL